MKSANPRFKLIRDTAAAKVVGAYVILSPRPETKYVANIHVYYPRSVDAPRQPPSNIHIDVYENGNLIHQYHGSREQQPSAERPGNIDDYPFGRALNGVRIAGICLFAPGREVNSSFLPIAGHEDKHYLPGLRRLQALGYEIIKAF